LASLIGTQKRRHGLWQLPLQIHIATFRHGAAHQTLSRHLRTLSSKQTPTIKKNLPESIGLQTASIRPAIAKSHTGDGISS